MDSVAISCTMNLSGPNLEAYFEQSILDSANSETASPKEPKRDDIKAILEPYRDHFISTDMDVGKLLSMVVGRKKDLMERNKTNDLEGKVNSIIEYL